MGRITCLLFVCTVIVLAVSSCSSTPTTPAAMPQPTVDVAAIQTKAAEDVIAQLTASAPTVTPTPAASPTPKPPTKTPTPENTPTLAPTATPEFQPVTQKIGPIYDSLHDSRYSVEITLKDVKWLTEDQYDTPKPGNVYVVADLSVKNLGPGALRGLALYNFQVKDANGAIRDYTMLASFYKTCQIDTVDLVADGSADGCATFEVPEKGKVELIYAPFQYEGLTPGRYMSFVLREN